MSFEIDYGLSKYISRLPIFMPSKQEKMCSPERNFTFVVYLRTGSKFL
jgi:hypothetical protein